MRASGPWRARPRAAKEARGRSARGPDRQSSCRSTCMPATRRPLNRVLHDALRFDGTRPPARPCAACRIACAAQGLPHPDLPPGSGRPRAAKHAGGRRAKDPPKRVRRRSRRNRTHGMTPGLPGSVDRGDADRQAAPVPGAPRDAARALSPVGYRSLLAGQFLLAIACRPLSELAAACSVGPCRPALRLNGAPATRA